MANIHHILPKPLAGHGFGPTRLTAALSLALAAAPSFVLAQTTPDAGRLLQQDRAAPVRPKTDSTLQIAPPLGAASLPGGTTVTLKEVRFTGNTLFSDAQLNAVLQAGPSDSIAKPYDLAGLQGLAHKVSAYYRSAGYPFARALIAEQTFADGVLQITVVEGRYGKVSTTGDARLAPQAMTFLQDLAPGAVIESARLERSMLILEDQPGIQTTPLIRPGQDLGSGDLVVEVSPTPRWHGDVALDNQGSRYTGEHRVRLNLSADSPFTLGDQVTLQGLVSEANQWLGNVGYSLPLGGSGLRGNVGYAHAYYKLGQQFANLDAEGIADITTLGLSYPLLRSQKSNLSLVASYQNKQLEDKQGSVNTQSNKTSDVVTMGLQFDHRDVFAGGGISYGSVVLTGGELVLDSTLRASDASTAQTQGSFQKWNLDVARVQATPLANLTLYGRAAAQGASKNLDSSEDFGLGGASGVRAYPGGEGFGDTGWLTQLEARYAVGAVTPYIFYDMGRVTINHSPFALGSNERSVSGGGVGVRFASAGWRVDASVAWRGGEGAPTSDTDDRNPRVWLNASWQF